MSAALEAWEGSSREALDDVEALHGRVEGTGAGSRLLTRQVNYAYVTLVVAHFQQYCSAIHTEASRALVAMVLNPELAGVLEVLLEEGRQLDRGNPTPRNLGNDFGRFGFKFWETLAEADLLNGDRKEKLEQLCEWRNAIVHGDIPRRRTAGRLVPSGLTLKTCRDWRRSLGALARSIDRVLAIRLQALGCLEPW